MTILLTGAGGQVGSAIHTLAQEKNISLIPLNQQTCDIAQEAQIYQFFEKHHPEFLINAAAYTAVDLAETHESDAMRINVDAVDILAKVCKAFDCILIHLSTDYVFDGNLNRSYRENDQTNPLSVYGKSKLLGEQLLQQRWEKYIILRISWVFGAQGKNFVKTVLRLAKSQTALKIVEDQRGCPTSASSIAKVIFHLISQLKNQFGIYHYCDQPVTTWFEFAKEILRMAQIDKTVTPIVTTAFPTPAVRPKNSELDCTKIEEVFGVQRYHWQTCVDAVVKAICVQDEVRGI